MGTRGILYPIKFKKNKSRRFVLPAIFVLAVSLAIIYFVRNSEANLIGNVSDKFAEILTKRPTPVPYKIPGVSSQLPSAKWVPQTFNNCSPAGTSMVLQYFGYNVTQEETKAHLRTNPDDKNVFINEVSAYLKKDYGIESKVLFNGNLKTIKTLVANGIYVVVEDWLHPNEDIGHFLIIRGFDDSEGVFIADDSYFGVGIKYPYQTWDEGQWKPYNREFMPVYLGEKELLVKSIIGENWDEKTMYQNSVERNQEDTTSNPNDMYAWFNLGTSYYGLGEYQKAKEAFEKSQGLGWPHRMLWYNILPVQTYNKLGLYQKAIDTANLGLWFNDLFAEMHYEKAVSYKGLGKTEDSRLEIEKTLESDPNFDIRAY